MQECREFFKRFFAFFSGHEDLKRHVHTDRWFAISFPKRGSKLEDLHELKTCIARLVQNLPYWEENIRPALAIFEYMLRKEINEKIVLRKRLSEFNDKIDTEFKLTEDEINKMLEYLNRVGSLLYRDEDHIRDIVILDVQWFADAFKSIVTYSVDMKNPNDRDRDYFRTTGELKDDQLDAIWKETQNEGKEYFKYKKEILSYMEHLGLLTVCESKCLSSETRGSKWYCFPSMNTKPFQVEHAPENFKSSSILCFQFDENGQFPIFVFYALVAKCIKMENWSIFEKNKQKCIYEKGAKFSFRHTFVVICICKFQIQVQVFLPPDINDKTRTETLEEIQTSVENKIREFKIYKYDVGYKCQKGKLFDESDNSFIALEDFPVYRKYCNRCCESKEHLVHNWICWVITFLLFNINCVLLHVKHCFLSESKKTHLFLKMVHITLTRSNVGDFMCTY